MIETTRPMSQGRLPITIGYVGITTDSLYGPYTNREVTFPGGGGIGYIANGYGKDITNSPFLVTGGFVNITPNGYDERIVTSGTGYSFYRTPKFSIGIVQDDVINRKWIGVTMELTADQTTDVYQFIEPGPAVLISSTSTPQTFSYTFSASDDPTIGSPDYLPPNQTIKEVLGTEYLHYSIEYSSYIYPVAFQETITTPAFLTWQYTAVSPPP